VTHEWLEQRSLALHVEIAKMIREKPELMDQVKATLQRWIRQDGEVTMVRAEWDNILKTSTIEEVLKLITRDNEEAQRLRKSSPFTGILPQEHRLAIFDEFERKLVPDIEKLAHDPGWEALEVLLTAHTNKNRPPFEE